MNDWNNSLTTDGLNNSRESGIWECGLIPCQPYSIWVQCNSIPVLFTELYDNMYGTDYMPIWDYGLWFANNIMQDDYGLFSDESGHGRAYDRTNEQGDETFGVFLLIRGERKEAKFIRRTLGP